MTQEMKTLFRTRRFTYTNRGLVVQHMRCLCGATVNKTRIKRHIQSEKHKRYIEQNPNIEAQRAAQDLKEDRELALYLGLDQNDPINALRHHREELNAYYARNNSENKTEQDRLIVERIRKEERYYDNYIRH
jgi:hypothetical protein